ncbi:MAG: oxidoreductase [Caulobacteraceae bacterium]|jgi:isoquinoline 1-oxidoreductase alpha subunit|nr:oxidoreductase [Caulobacteraceae bacterium]
MDYRSEWASPPNGGLRPPPRAPHPPGSRAPGLRVNGRAMALAEGSAARPLIEVLRNDLGLTVAKRGCAGDGRTACGACTVLLDGRAVAACGITAGDASDGDIVTIEGLVAEPDNRVIAAFAAEEALGCGDCWPGIVLAAAALLEDHWRPSDAEIDKAMSAVSCRCGAPPNVRRAIRRAAGCPPG